MFDRGRRLKQGLELLDVNALHQVLVVAYAVAYRQGNAYAGKGQRPALQKHFDLVRQNWQYRLEVSGQQPEGFHANRANVVQTGIHALLLGQFPGLVGIHVFVDAIGQQHGLAQCLGKLAGFVQLFDTSPLHPQLVQQRGAVSGDIAQSALKALGDEASGA